jgi:hypothetical protein
MNHAVQLMEQHPALKYGSIFEIRPAADMNEVMKASEQRRDRTLHAEGRPDKKRPILRRKTMRKKKVGAIAIKSFALLVVLGTAYQAMTQDATTPYPNMAPIHQYLMDRTAEIALAAAQRRSPFRAMPRCSWTTCLRNCG